MNEQWKVAGIFRMKGRLWEHRDAQRWVQLILCRCLGQNCAVCWLQGGRLEPSRLLWRLRIRLLPPVGFWTKWILSGFSMTASVTLCLKLEGTPQI